MATTGAGPGGDATPTRGSALGGGGGGGGGGRGGVWGGGGLSGPWLV
eukprot:SAG31_NODE_543_length_14248_cov_3.230900_9_plen_47_part_00